MTRPLTGQLAGADLVPSPCRGLWRSQAGKLFPSPSFQKSLEVLRPGLAPQSTRFHEAKAPPLGGKQPGLCLLASEGPVSRKDRGSGSCTAPNKKYLEFWPSADESFVLHLGPRHFQREARLQYQALWSSGFYPAWNCGGGSTGDTRS